MKSEKEQEYHSLRERYIRHFAIFGVENIMYALYDSSAWSNGLDYIFPIIGDSWNIIGMKAGLFNLGTGEYFEPLVFTAKQDFFDFLADLMAVGGNQHPDTQKYYELAVEKFEKFERYK